MKTENIETYYFVMIIAIMGVMLGFIGSFYEPIKTQQDLLLLVLFYSDSILIILLLILGLRRNGDNIIK